MGVRSWKCGCEVMGSKGVRSWKCGCEIMGKHGCEVMMGRWERGGDLASGVACSNEERNTRSELHGEHICWLVSWFCFRKYCQPLLRLQ